MKINKKLKFDDANFIDLRELFIILWKNKLLILFLSFGISIIGYIYAASANVVLRSEIKLKSVERFLFTSPYRMFYNLKSISHFDTNSNIKIDNIDLNSIFFTNLSSNVTFNEFLDQNNEFKNGQFTIPLIDKTVEDKSYFVFYFTFNNDFKGKDFLNKYVQFVKSKSEKEFTEQMSQMILNEIRIYEKHLELASKINLIDPVINEAGNDMFFSYISTDLYHQGTTILTNKLSYLQDIYDMNKNIKVNFNPYFSLVSDPSIVSKSKEFIVVIAFILGIIISVVIVILKSFLEKKNI